MGQRVIPALRGTGKGHGGRHVKLRTRYNVAPLSADRQRFQNKFMIGLIHVLKNVTVTAVGGASKPTVTPTSQRCGKGNKGQDDRHGFPGRSQIVFGVGNYLPFGAR